MFWFIVVLVVVVSFVVIVVVVVEIQHKAQTNLKATIQKQQENS